MQTKKIIIYTDGSALGNPGRGGWGAVIVLPDNHRESKVESKKSKVVELGGYESSSTNNRMELTAVIESLIFLEKGDYMFNEIEIHSDSSYVLNGITSWVHSWERNGWITSTKDPVLNRDLWMILLELVRYHQNSGKVLFKKVKGHSGVPGNERTDAIATGFSENQKFELYTGTLAHYETILGGELSHTGSTTKAKGKTKSKKSSKPGYSYVSLIDGKIHIDATWAECEKRVKGVKGAKYQKAMDKKDEAEIIHELKAKD